MKDIQICLDKNSNSYGDIDISSNDLTLNGNEKQKIFISLRIFKGEWFLDKNFGVPYFQYIFQKGINKANIDMVITNYINNCLESKYIRNFSSTLNDDKNEYSFNCIIDGNIIEGGFKL